MVGSRAGLSVPVAMREVRQADLATIRDPGWLRMITRRAISYCS